MEQISVEEVIRDLLVYLKGQAPLLETLDDKQAIIAQVQTMATGLRSTLEKLDTSQPAADNSHKKKIEELEAQLEGLVQSKKLVEQDLEQALANKQQANSGLEEEMAKLKEAVAGLESQLAEEKALNQRFAKEIDQFKETAESAKAEVEGAKEAETKLVEQVSTLEGEFTRQLSEITALQEAEANLKELLTDASTELEQANAALKEAENLENYPEFLEFREKAQGYEKLERTQEALQSQLTALEAELKRELELRHKNEAELAESSAVKLRAKVLEEEQIKTVALLGTLKGQLDEATDTLNKSSLERQQYLHQIAELESTLKSVISSQEELTKQYQGRFAISSEDCVNIFNTLTLAYNRLEHSIENKDLYKKVADTLILFKKSNAMQQVATVGQLYDPEMHRASRAFISAYLPDGMVLHEESTGFITGGKVIEKAKVWIAKSKFTCTDCSNVARAHEFFCPKCGLELAAPNGASKQQLQEIPKDVQLLLPALDRLIKQGELEVAKKLITEIETENPNNSDLLRRKDLVKAANLPY